MLKIEDESLPTEDDYEVRLAEAKRDLAILKYKYGIPDDENDDHAKEALSEKQTG